MTSAPGYEQPVEPESAVRALDTGSLAVDVVLSDGRVTLLLTGIAVNAFTGAGLAFLTFLGDQQARELKNLIEGAGPDIIGVCLDSGNPVWTIEDPHLTLETLAPYVLTSHMRDSALWRTPEGVAVRWVRMGDGNTAKVARECAQLARPVRV